MSSSDALKELRKYRLSMAIIVESSGKTLGLVTIEDLIEEIFGEFEDIFDKNNEAEIDHISLSRWADLIIVLPTTANFMTKLSIGKAEDLATTVLLASNKDILLVPAMNVRMWLHKATQRNLKTLQDYGYYFIGPEKGEMACGEYGDCLLYTSPSPRD